MVGDKLKGLRCRATAYLTFLNRRGIRVRDYLIIVNKNGDFFFFFFIIKRRYERDSLTRIQLEIVNWSYCLLTTFL